MDPYDYTQTVHVESHEDNEDELQQLEKDLAPSAADFYAILNISKQVTQMHSFLNNY